MSITVGCSKCGIKAEVPNSAAGAKGKCRVCGGIVHVPRITKMCSVCGVDVANQKRTKDQHGNYYCEQCWSARTVSQQQSLQAPAFPCGICGGSFNACEVYEDGEQYVCKDCHSSRASLPGNGADDSINDPFAAIVSEAEYELANEPSPTPNVSSEGYPLTACVLCGGKFIYSYLRNVNGQAICIECDDARRARSGGRKSGSSKLNGVSTLAGKVWWIVPTLGVLGISIIVWINSSAFTGTSGRAGQGAGDGSRESEGTSHKEAIQNAEESRVEAQRAEEAHREQEADKARRKERSRVFANVQRKLEVYYSSVYPPILRDLSTLENVGKGTRDRSDAQWLTAFIDAYTLVLQDEKQRLAQAPMMTDNEKAALGETYNELGSFDASLATRLKCSENLHQLAIAILTDAVNGRWQGQEPQAGSLIAEIEAAAIAYHRDAERQHGVSISQLNLSELHGWKARLSAEGLSSDDVAIASAATDTMRKVQAKAQGVVEGIRQAALVQNNEVGIILDYANVSLEHAALSKEIEALDRVSDQPVREAAARGDRAAVEAIARPILEKVERSKQLSERVLHARARLEAYDRRQMLRALDSVIGDQHLSEEVRAFCRQLKVELQS